MSLSKRTRAASLRHRRVVITSGPTREYLDPVRYITNASSGAMGAALARAARRRGAQVVVVSGPSCVPMPSGVSVRPVVTARQMLAKTLSASRGADVVIGAAAVGDWRSVRPAMRKIKRKGAFLTLKLLPNPDILREVARRRRPSQTVVVGFALETDSLLRNARTKLRKKGLDLIVANTQASIGSKKTRIAILDRRGRARRFALASKNRAAGFILDAAARELKARGR